MLGGTGLSEGTSGLLAEGMAAAVAGMAEGAGGGSMLSKMDFRTSSFVRRSRARELRNLFFLSIVKIMKQTKVEVGVEEAGCGGGGAVRIKQGNVKRNLNQLNFWKILGERRSNEAGECHRFRTAEQISYRIKKRILRRKGCMFLNSNWVGMAVMRGW